MGSYHKVDISFFSLKTRHGIGVGKFNPNHAICEAIAELSARYKSKKTFCDSSKTEIISKRFGYPGPGLNSRQLVGKTESNQTSLLKECSGLF